MVLEVGLWFHEVFHALGDVSGFKEFFPKSKVLFASFFSSDSATPDTDSKTFLHKVDTVFDRSLVFIILWEGFVELGVEDMGGIEPEMDDFESLIKDLFELGEVLLL